MNSVMNTSRNILLSLVGGLLIGIVAAYGDTLSNSGQFDIVWLVSNYFNTPTLWAVSAFLVGTLSSSKKQSAFLGILLLLTAVFSYYIYGRAFGNRTDIMIDTLLKATYVWSLIAVVIGTLYGTAGSVWKYSKDVYKKVGAFVLLPVLIISENVYYILISKEYFFSNWGVSTIYLGMILIGMAIPFLFMKDIKRASLVVVISLLLSVFGVVILSYVLNAVRGLGI